MRHFRWLCALAALLAVSPASAAASKVLAKVGKTAITERDVMARVMQLLPQMSFHRRISPKLVAKLRQTALDQLIEEQLLFAEGVRRGLVPTKDEIRKAKQQQIAQAGGEQRFAHALGRRHMGWAEHWRLLRRQLTARNVLEKLAPVKPVTEADLRAHYAQHRARYKQPPAVKLGRVLYPVSPSASAAEGEGAAARARETIKQLRAGAAYDALKPGGKAQKDSVRWFHRHQLIDDVDAAAFKLKPGEVSQQPLRVLDGYLVLKAFEVRPERQLAYADVADKLRKELVTDAAKRRRESLIEKLTAATTIVRAK